MTIIRKQFVAYIALKLSFGGPQILKIIKITTNIKFKNNAKLIKTPFCQINVNITNFTKKYCIPIRSNTIINSTISSNIVHACQLKVNRFSSTFKPCVTHTKKM